MLEKREFDRNDFLWRVSTAVTVVSGFFSLIVFLLLGFVAGVLNVMRAAGVVAPSKLPGGNADKP